MGLLKGAMLGHHVKVELLRKLHGVHHAVDKTLLRIIVRQVFILDEGRHRHAVGELAVEDGE